MISTKREENGMKKAWIRIGVTLILLALCVAASFFFLTQRHVCDTCGEETSDIAYSYEEGGETKYACADCARTLRKALREKGIRTEDVDLQLPRSIAIAAAFVLALAIGFIPALVQLIHACRTSGTAVDAVTEAEWYGASVPYGSEADGERTVGPWDFGRPDREPDYVKNILLSKDLPSDPPPVTDEPPRASADTPAASGRLKSTMRTHADNH